MVMEISGRGGCRKSFDVVNLLIDNGLTVIRNASMVAGHVPLPRSAPLGA